MFWYIRGVNEEKCVLITWYGYLVICLTEKWIAPHRNVFLYSLVFFFFSKWHAFFSIRGEGSVQPQAAQAVGANFQHLGQCLRPQLGRRRRCFLVGISSRDATQSRRAFFAFREPRKARGFSLGTRLRKGRRREACARKLRDPGKKRKAGSLAF